jgi:hypothetical protein
VELCELFGWLFTVRLLDDVRKGHGGTAGTAPAVSGDDKGLL